MLENKDYCDYDTSIDLGELGFPLKRMKVRNFIDGKFSDSIVTVLLYEAQKWLREEKGIIVGIINNFTIQAFDWYVSTWEEDLCRGNKYVSYEEALSEGIKEAIKILKDGIGE